MGKLKLSSKAEEAVKRLINFKGSDKVGYIAAVDPQTGETFYGKTVVEAAKKGREAKNRPKAVFFFVRVGYPSVHVLKSINLQGYIHQDYFPTVKGYVHNRNLHLVGLSPIHSPSFSLSVGEIMFSPERWEMNTRLKGLLFPMIRRGNYVVR